jgi:hypothetical protein
MGTIPATFLLQALLVIISNWEYGTSVWEGLTEFEKRSVMDMVAMHQQQMELAAEEFVKQ